MSLQNNDINQYGAEDFERYYSGKMTEQEMHALEKAALDDPFLSDALDGYAYTKTPVADINELRSKLVKKEDDKKVIWYKRKTVAPVLKIAAVLILVTGIGLLIFKNNSTEKENQLATITDKNDNTEGLSNNWYNADSSVISQDRQLAVIEPSANAADRQGLTQSKQPGTIEPVTANGNKLAQESVSLPSQGYSVNPGTDKDYDYYRDDASKKERKAGSENALSKGTTLRGKITDGNGSPVAFATIVDKKNNTGTQANMQGEFEFIAHDSIAKVDVNAVGYATVSRELRNDSSANNLVLLEKDNTLKEVVVTSAFQTKRTLRSQSSNVQNVSSETLNTVPASGVNNTIAGKVAGAQVKSQSSKVEEINTRDSKSVNRVAVTNAIPQNGWQQFNKYVNDSLKTVLQLGPSTVSTEVQLSFDVNDKGEPIDINVKRSLCSPCDEEAVRIIKNGPGWKLNKKRKKANVIVRF